MRSKHAYIHCFFDLFSFMIQQRRDVNATSQSSDFDSMRFCLGTLRRRLWFQLRLPKAEKCHSGELIGRCGEKDRFGFDPVYYV